MGRTHLKVLGAVFFLALATFILWPPSGPVEAAPEPVSVLHPTEIFSADSTARNLFAAFNQAGVQYYPEDKISAFPDPELGLGTVVTVTRALPIAVQEGKRSYQLRTWQETVGTLLSEKKIELGAEDRVAPTLETPLTPNLKVTITRVARTNVVETEVIPFQTVVEKDYQQFTGSQTVLEPGKNGQRQKTYLVIRQFTENDELVSKTLVSSSIVLQPKAARVRQGALNKVSAKCLTYKDWVIDASLKNKIDPNALYHRMVRESNCNYNSQAAAGYQGLFQYDPSFWVSVSAKAGHGGASIWDAKSQIYVTAWAWSHGYRSRWPG